MSLKRSSTYCQRSLRSGSFREIPHRQQERLAIADFELRRAMRTSQSQGRLLELVAMSRIPSRPQTVSACLQRSKIWLMVLAAGHKSQPLCGVSSVHCFLAMLSLVLRRPRKASQRKTRCLCDAGGHRYRSGARWGDREGQ